MLSLVWFNYYMQESEETENYVLYLVDETVRNNSIFDAFVNGEITVCENGEEKYIYEYFTDYPVVFGVHYMAEDLDDDMENELLVFLQSSDSSGDLFVFDERDGELYKWEVWEDFLHMRMMAIQYYGKGIFSKGGGAGDIFARYNADEKIEYIMGFDRDIEYTEDKDKYLERDRLVLFKDDMIEKEFIYEGFRYFSDDTWEMTPENQKIKNECDALMNEIREELGEGKPIERIEWEDKAEKITLDELLNPN